MNALKKILSLTLICILLYNLSTNVYASTTGTTQEPIKVAVFLLDSKELFLSYVKSSLENIQKENKGKVEFTFFDSNRNQSTQNQNISKALNEHFNLFVVNPASKKPDELKDIFKQVTGAQIPLILLSPPSISLANFARNYPNTIIIGGDEKEAGILKGKILVDLWNANKKTMDKNNDDVMQYVTLLGQKDNPATIDRNKYTLQALNDAGINTQELSETYCDWDEECAKTAIESSLLRYGDTIEVIISNSDGMALGAIEALQKYGYNTGDKSKYIPVVGVGGFPEAIELINQGAMAGTVTQDSQAYANAIYKVGMNMISGNNPLSGTNYKFDETGNTIKLPYYEYTK